MSQLTSPRRGGVRRSFALLAAIVFAVFAGGAGAQTIALQSAQVLDTAATAITAVALAPNGDLYVAEGTGGVMYYPANGTSAAVTGITGGDNITKLAAGPAGNVFAVDSTSNTIWKINAGAVTQSGSLTNPVTALAVSGGTLYFDNPGGGGLFSVSTSFTTSNFASIIVAGNTDTTPYAAMAIDGSGNIYLGEFGGTIKLTTITGYVSNTPAASSIAATPAITNLTGLAVDGSGNLYVTEQNNGADTRVLQVTSPSTGTPGYNVITSNAGTTLSYVAVTVGARNNLYWAQTDSSGPDSTLQVHGAANFRGQNMHATSGAITLTYIVSGGLVAFNGTNPYVVYDGGGNDFAVTGSTCTGTVSTACTILVTFTPNDRPGLRRGSLVLLDGSNKQLAVTYLRGYAVGPGAAMNYYADSTNAFFLSRKFNMTPTFTTSTGPIGITVNALPNAGNPLNSGNIYTSNYGTTSPYTSNVTDFNFGANTGAAALTDVSGFASSNISLATDASGDLYVASNTAASVTLVPNENGTLNVTDKVTNGTSLTPANTSGTNSVFSASDSALAADANGNVYVAVANSGGTYGVVEIPAGSNSGTAYTVMSGLGNQLYGVAVDASGNVYTADLNTIYVAAPTGPGTWGPPNSTTFAVTKLTASGGQIKAGPALDASGNLYVAGNKVQTWVRFPSTGGSGTSFNIAGLLTTGGLAVDAEGGVYFTTNGGTTGAARGYDQYDDPSANTSTSGLSGKAFGSVNVGSSDASAPGGTYVGAIFNTGNQNLVITSVANSDATDFSFGTSNTCTATGLTLNPGQSCLVYVVFNPKSPATFNDTVTFTDNANNGTNVTQTLWAASGHTITGTGLATATKLVYPNAAPVAMVGGNFGTVAVDLDNSGGSVQNVSSPNVTIAVTGPSGFAGCTSAATAPVAGEASVALTSCVPTVAGSYTLTATVPGNSLTLATETATVYNSASAGSTTVGVAANATVTFNFSSTVAVNSVVATSAAGGGAFTALGTGTCTTNGLPHTYNAGNSCTVNYTFTPSNPGLSRGAITLYSSINAPLAAVFVNGTGTGPLPAYAVPAVASIGSSLTNISGLAAWGSGFYAATVGGNLEQITAGGSVTTICSTCLDANPSVDQSVAVDGAGNVYSVASDPANGTQTIWEFTNKNGTLSTVPGAYASNLNVGTTAEPGLLAVDGSGNLFAALPGANTIVEYPATNPAITPTGVTIATGLTSPHGLALDPSGDLFFTGAGGLLKEITAAQIAGALPASPASVGTANITGGDFNATDANGDIYTLTGTGDKLLTQYLNSAGFTGTPANTYTFAGTSSVVATGLSISQGGGHVTIADSANATLDQLTSYNVPTGSNSPFAFGVINVNATNGPNNLVLENIGNAGLTLTGTPALASGTQFNTTGTTCSTGAIAAGSTCTLAATFAPTKPGPLSDSFNVNFPAGFIIGAVPAAPGLSGTGTGTPSVTVSTISNSTYGSTPNPTVTVACSVGCSGSPTPTGTVAWKLNGSVQTPVSLVSGVATLNVNVPNNLAAGNNQTVEVTGYSSGDSNYTNIPEGSITNAGPQTFNVAKKGLDLTGLAVSPKTYDGTTTAGLTGTAAIQGGEVIGGDTVSVTGTPTGAYNFKDVATATTVTVSGLSLTGAQAANYSLNPYTISATISAKGLDATGLAVTPKTYDGTTTAALTGTAAIQGGEVIGGDTVSVTGTPAGAFNVKDTSATSVAVSGLSLTGAQSGDYSLNAYSIPASGKISAKAVDLTGLAVSAKTYDGTTTAALTGSAAIQGGEVIGGDSVSVTGTATGAFNFKDVPTATTVTVSGLSLTGAQAADYTPNAYTISATISAKGLDATGLAVTPKTYDGTTAAALTGTAAIQGGEVIGGDTVSVTGTPAGAFNVKDTSATSVAVSGLSLTGAQSGDYSLNAYSIPASGKISAKAVDLTGLAVTAKPYDGTTTAALTGSAAIQGGEVIGGDSVSVTGAPSGAFNSSGVATATTVTVSGLSLTGAQAADYTPNAYTISATISPLALTIKALPAATTITYGAASPAVTPIYSPTTPGVGNYSALTTGPTCGYTGSPAQPLHVTGGPWGVQCAGAADTNGNYSISYDNTATVTVTPLTVNVWGQPLSAVIGNVPSQATLNTDFKVGTSAGGALAGSDSQSTLNLSGTPAITISANNASPVGVYTITVGNGTLAIGDANYSLGSSPQNSTLNLTPAPVVLAETAVGQTSGSTAVTFLFNSNTTVGSVGVLTNGVSSGAFASADSSNCVHTFSTNGTCTVDVTFTPTAPGLTRGAVVLYDAGGNQISIGGETTTIPISGIGDEPIAAYVNSNQTAGTALGTATNIQALAEDASGDLYLATGGGSNTVTVLNPNGSTKSTLSILQNPTSIAVDGAGNVFIADPANHNVDEIPLEVSGLSTANTSILATLPGNGSTLNPASLATDASGNLYYIDQASETVNEYVVSANTTLAVGSGWVTPTALALDSAGNVYVADSGTDGGNLSKVAAGGGSQSELTSSLGTVNNLSVDAAGDIYLSAGTTVRVLDQAVDANFYVASLGSAPTGLVIDPQGILYATPVGSTGVTPLDLRAPVVPDFGPVQAFTSSTTNLQFVNAGNSALNFGGSPVTVGTGEFSLNGTNCIGTLGYGHSCTIMLAFTPTASSAAQGGGEWTDTLSINDNAPAGATPGTQTAALSGTGTAIPQTINFSAFSPATVPYGTSPITLSATGGASGNPVTFAVDSGPGSTSGTNGTTLTITGAGSVVVAANQAQTTDGSGNVIYAAATLQHQTLNVTPASLTISGIGIGSKTYDGTTAATITGTAVLNGVVSPDSITLVGTPTASFVSANANASAPAIVSGYSISGANSASYILTQPSGLSGVISPAALQITASSFTGGSSMIYGGTVPTITPIYGTFAGSDNAGSLTTPPACVTAATSTSPVGGSYATSCSGAADANYAFSYVPGTVSINPASLTITASNASMIVGGTVPAISPIYSGFAAGDTSASLTTAPTCTTDTYDLANDPVTSATAVGVYATLCSGAADSNYTIGYNPGTISVTPAPVVAPATAVGSSSATFTVTFAFTAPSTTVASVGVYSYGQSGKDFTSTDTANCTAAGPFGTASLPTSCAVDVTFTPQAPGLREGAVVLYDGSGNPIPGQTIAISGVGQAPVAIYPVSNGVSTLGSGLTAPAAMATDATGDFFIADGDVIREIPAAGGAAASVYGVGAPITGITVDGAGNVYIAEASTHEVFKVVNGATGLQTGSVSPIVNDSVSLPGAMAADGAGNVYYVDGNTNTVVELLQAGGTATLGNSLVTPTAITLDASGNLYIADNGANSGAGAIYEVPAGGGAQTTYASGTAATLGGAITQMATDAAGNVYATGPSGLAVFSPGSSTPAVLNSSNDTGLALSGNGLVTFSTSGAAGLSQMNLAAAPATLAAFPATQALSASAASALQIVNIGNLPLTFNSNPSVGTSEYSASTSTCSTSNTVAAGNDCNVNVVFSPTAAAIWTDAVGISTNSLNATTTASVGLSGTGTAIPQVITGFNAPAPVAYSATPITIQDVTGGASGQPVTYTLVSGPATLSGTNNGTITTTGVGTVTIQANQAGTTDGSGNTIYAAATAVQQSLTVNQAALTITGATVAAKAYNGQVNDAVIGGTPVLNGIVGSDVVTLSGTPTGVYANANAGDTVGVTVSGYTLGGANAANYTLTQPSLTGVINKALATITGAAVNSKVYDGTTTATLGTTIGLGGILPADDANVSPAGAPVATFAQAGIGTAIPVTVSGYALSGPAAGNYVLSQPTGLTANITAAPLTVTANNATRAFGAPNPTFNATLTGFVNNETAAVVTGAAAMTTTATATSDPGTFAITPSLGSLAAANYSFVLVNGTLTVTTATQTITFPTIPSTVPGSQVTLQATASSGLPVSYTIVSGSATLSGSTLSVTGPGTITVKATQAGNIDYSAATAVSQSFSAGAPAVTLGGNFNSSGQLVFGTQATGTTSTAQTVTVINSGSAPLVVSTATAEAPFAASTTCATVAAGASCSISVTFNPTAAGNASGTLTITDSASTSPQTVTLIGTGVAPGAALAPNALGFGSVALGSASVAQSLTITNTGSATLHVSQVAATGDFAVAGNCSAIPAGGACSVAVTFTPTVAGNRSGTITVSDDASGGTQTVNASGFGATAGALVGPGAATFPPQVVGTTSFPQTVTLTNTGTAALTGVSIGVSGSFSESSTSCAATVAAGASCAVNVVFKPTLAGATNGSVQVTDNLGAQSAALRGTGLQAGANLSATVLYFGTQLTGTSSNGQTVTLTNSGTAALAITSIAASTGFTATSNCLSPTLGTGSLAAGSSCNINVSFAPGATGIQIGTLTVVDGAGTQTASTAGIGVAQGLILSTSSAQFGSVEVGSNSLAQTLTITNSGSVGLALDAPLVAGDFAATDNCPSPLQPGATCQLSVLFTPTAVGSRSGTVQITAPGALAVATLNGTGTLPGISASPAALFFGGDAVGTASAAQTITVTNTGTAALTVSAVTATGDFSASGTCANQTLAAGANCVINAVLTPTTIGTRTGSISILNNANGVQTVALSGVGQSATATLAPTALAFGSQPVLSGGAVSLTGKPQTVTLSNNGNVALAISGITISGDFAQSNTCGTSLAAGAACSISVSFNPTGLNQRTGTLTLSDSAGSQTLALNGVGSPTGLVLTPSVLNFGGTTVGQTTAAQTVTVNNGTGQAVNNLQIVASGEFAQSNTCGTSIATGASCTISITLTPATAGAVTGSIAINGALGGVGSGAEGLMRPNAANPSRQMLAAVALGASGNPAAIQLSSATLSFSSEPVGTASAAQTVTITNSGATASLTALTVTSTPDFPITTTCGATLAAGATCTVSAAFKPTAAGARTGAVTIAATAGSSNLQAQIALSGQATGGVLTATPSSLVFPSQATATTSAAQTVTLTNTGGATLNISAIALSGSDFTLAASTCGTLPQALASGASCALSVTYAPAAAGASTGSISITSDGGTAVVALSGTASNAGLVLSSTAVNFGSVGVGITGTKTVTLTNSGTVAVAISSITASSGFAESNNCGASVAAGATCTVTVTYTPSAAGSNSGTLVVQDAAGAQQATLSGSATNYAVGAASATSATVGSGGGTATFSLQYTPGTFTGTVSIGCSGVPAFATCTVNPASLALTAGGAASTVQVTVTTTGRSLVPPVAPPASTPRMPLLWLLALALFLAGLAAALKLAPANKRRQAVLGAVIWGAILAAGCGGVSNLPTAGNGTPAGTYVISVTSRAGAATQVTNFTLTVD